MKKKALILFAGLLVILLSTTAWAEIDPRNNFGSCGFTSIEETYLPDAGGTLDTRVRYVSECDTPVAGEETITITTEGWDGGVFGVTEVREAVRTGSGDLFNTTTLIYDGDGLLLGKEDHLYDDRVSNTNVWWQDWTDYDWNGSSFVITGYTSRETVYLVAGEPQVTYIYYDTTPRAEPTIPNSVPVLGSTAAAPLLPPPGAEIEPGDYNMDPRMLERVRNVLTVNPNTPVESSKFYKANFKAAEEARAAGESRCLYPVPPGVYVAGVLMGDRFDDPGVFSGFFHRWVRWVNDVAGNLTPVLGWTSDRDENEPTGDWWQARVRQEPSGAIHSIENAHRVGETYEDHYDTYTVLNSMFMIETQTVKTLDYAYDVYDDFTQETIVTGSMAQPLSYTMWTVDFD